VTETLFDALRRQACESPRGIRVLIVFGNPLGNALGDTFIAVQHLRYWRDIEGARITVWTSAGEAWCGESLDVHTQVFIGEDELVEFDVIVFDWNNLGPDLRNALEKTRSTIIVWSSPNSCVRIRLNGAWAYHELPPNVNQPARIGEMYCALGWRLVVEASLGNMPANSPKLYFNPFGSTSRKCLPPALSGALLSRFQEHLPDVAVAIHVPVRNGNAEDMSYYDDIVKAFPDSLREAFLEREVDSISDYIDDVKNAGIAVSCDTSTQHLAGLLNVPAIVLYPGDMFWFYGWRWENSWCILFKQPEMFEPLSELVCDLARRRFGKPPVFFHIEDRALFKARVEHYLGKLSSIQSEGIACASARELDLLVDEFSEVVPRRYLSFLLPELKCVNRELRDTKLWRLNGVETISKTTRNLNAVRILIELIS
jgi:hypothetical protein